MKDKVYASKAILSNFEHFTSFFGSVKLRPYQVEAAQAVLKSVLAQDGDSFIWKFARQGGKDETLAALYQYLMIVFSGQDSSIVTAAPTFKPQTELAMKRLESRLESNRVLKHFYNRQSGYIFNILRSSTIYFSADHSASVVGATAWPLLVMNEAQDISPALYDKRFAPMAASNNATKLFSGTAWTSDTLLAREERACRLKELEDGKKRVFLVTGDDIAKVHPRYGMFLKDQIERNGKNHPVIRTQYFCEEIDAQAGMFNETRMAMMIGDQAPHVAPLVGNAYAFLIDVAGQDEASMDFEGLGNPGRDSTTLSIVDVDLTSLDTLMAPTYRVVQRYAWQGENHLSIFGKLKNLAETWNPQHIAVDATGVGEGLWAMLDKTFPTRVIPVKFSQQVKSEVGWGFLAAIETGRFRDCTLNDEARVQYSKCVSQIMPGPTKTLRWGVPDGTRGPDGLLVHDDHVLADALVAVLDKLEWISYSPTLMIHPADPLLEMDGKY